MGRETDVQAWLLFRHSVRQVTGNLGAAMRISLLPMGLQVTVSLGLIAGLTGALDGMGAASPGQGVTAAVLVSILIMTLTAFWLAVAWHRFVLLKEAPTGWVPGIDGRPLLAYLRRSIVCLVILGLVASALLFVCTVAVKLLGVVAAPLLLAMFLLIVALPVMVLGLRLAASLPAAAIGAEGDFTTGWQATRGATLDIALLALLLILIQIALEFLGLMLVAANLPILSTAWQIAVSWLVAVIAISVLTTLYGHYVEGRELV